MTKTTIGDEVCSRRRKNHLVGAMLFQEWTEIITFTSKMVGHHQTSIKKDGLFRALKVGCHCCSSRNFGYRQIFVASWLRIVDIDFSISSYVVRRYQYQTQQAGHGLKGWMTRETHLPREKLGPRGGGTTQSRLCYLTKSQYG